MFRLSISETLISRSVLLKRIRTIFFQFFSCRTKTIRLDVLNELENFVNKIYHWNYKIHILFPVNNERKQPNCRHKNKRVAYPFDCAFRKQNNDKISLQSSHFRCTNIDWWFGLENFKRKTLNFLMKNKSKTFVSFHLIGTNSVLLGFCQFNFNLNEKQKRKLRIS